MQLKIEHCQSNQFDYFRFLYRPNNEVQIQETSSGLCLQREGNRALNMQPCNTGVRRQCFILQNGSIATRFEIEPADFRGWCITQRHHPKPDETLALESTPGVRADQTSYWNAY